MVFSFLNLGIMPPLEQKAMVEIPKAGRSDSTGDIAS
jgi:hypothetical protein